MATSRTRNLRLFLSSGLSTEAKANLEILDRLGGVYQVDNSESVNLRSKTDIRLLPGDPSAGGNGSSNLYVGSEGTPVSEFKVYASVFEVNGSLRLPDYQVPLATRKYLTIRYDSTRQGAADTAADRELLLDIQNGDRALILAQDLELAGGFKIALTSTAETAVTLPTEGVLATLENEETLKNKTINVGSPDGNVISGLTDASVAIDAEIDLRKLSRKTAINNVTATTMHDIVKELQEDIDTRATIANFTEHVLDKSVHGVNSDVVGVSDAQSLSNKTLVAPVFSGRPSGLQKIDVGLSKVDNYSAAELAALSQELTNKSIAGNLNNLSNIPRDALLLTHELKDSDWSVAHADKLTYEKLNLTNKITNTDIISNAQIAYSKLALTSNLRNADWSTSVGDRLSGDKVDARFGAQHLETQLGVKIGGTFKTSFGVQSQTQDLNFRFPPNAGGQNFVLVTDGLGNTSWSASQAGGSVSKVGLTTPNIFNVTTLDGSGAVIPVEPGESIPFITATGQFNISLASQTANLFLASPLGSEGTPSFRSIQETDLPAPLNSSVNRNGMVSGFINTTIKSSANNSITWSYDAGTLALTPTITLGVFSTADLPEGSRLYYTDERVFNKAKLVLPVQDGTSSGIIIAHNADTIGLSLRQATINTDAITEGTNNIFFSVTRSRSAIDGYLADSAEIAKTPDNGSNQLAFSLKVTGVTAGSYGSATKTTTINVDNKGRLLSASEQDIAIPSTQVTDFIEAVQDVVGQQLVGQSNDIAPTYDDDGASLSLALRKESITSKTEASPAPEDYLLVADASEGDALKKVNLQAIANLSGANHTAVWETADGTSKSITHNLGSRDVLIQLYSLDTYEDILVESIVRTSENVIDLTASEAPTGSGWKVLIRRI